MFFPSKSQRRPLSDLHRLQTKKTGVNVRVMHLIVIGVQDARDQYPSTWI